MSLKYIWPQNLMSSGYPLNLKGEHLRGKAVVYWTFNKPKEVFRWKRKILCNFGKNLNHFFFFLEKNICILLKIGVVLSAALSPITSIRVLDLIVTLQECICWAFKYDKELKTKRVLVILWLTPIFMILKQIVIEFFRFVIEKILFVCHWN